MESAECKKLFCDSHAASMIAGLEQLWRENQFCDVTLTVEGREFSCHKNVLVACSEYFTSVFKRDFKEKEKNFIVLPPAFEIVPFQTLLEYFYSGSLLLSRQNAEGVYKLADYMRLDAVVELATKYLAETLNGSNCISRFLATDSVQYKRPSGDNLEKAAALRIVKEAAKDSVTVNFLELSGKQMSKILALGSQPESAEGLFLSVVHWVRHNEGNRRLFLRDLLKLIPVAGLSFAFYETHIKTEELLRRNPEGLEWVVDSVMPHLTNRMRIAPVVPHVTNPVYVAQNPQQSLFAANRYESRKCYQLQISNSTALPVSERPEIELFSAISHKKRIYLMCGDNTKKTFILEEGRSWVESEVDLYFNRCLPGSIVMEDDLFVIGGWGGGMRLNSCEKFNFATQERVCMPNMKENRSRPGVGVFENSIYAAGGCSATIERFDPREGQWSVVGSFNSCMYECSSATIGNLLFTCDCCNGRVMRFDFRSNRSEEVSSLWAGDGYFNWITSLNDHMYAARGNGSVFKYDRESHSWTEFRSGLELEVPIIVPWSEFEFSTAEEYEAYLREVLT